jgi:hypothetical protein
MLVGGALVLAAMYLVELGGRSDEATGEVSGTPPVEAAHHEV